MYQIFNLRNLLKLEDSGHYESSIVQEKDLVIVQIPKLNLIVLLRSNSKSSKMDLLTENAPLFFEGYIVIRFPEYLKPFSVTKSASEI